MANLLIELKWWWFRRRHEYPSNDEIRSYMPLEGLTPAFREVARLYAVYGYTIEDVAQYFNSTPPPPKDPPEIPGQPRRPTKNFSLRMMYGRCSRERIRQMLWKIRRTQRVARSLRKAL